MLKQTFLSAFELLLCRMAIRMKNEQAPKPVKVDKRVIKTKKLLKESLLTLLEQKPLKQITVTELTELANVNRSTFYFYYDDTYDMLEKVWNEVYEAFIEAVVNRSAGFGPIQDYDNYIVPFLDFCKENERLASAIIRSDVAKKFADRVISDIRKTIPDSQNFFSRNSVKCYLTTYALNGIVGTVLQWIHDGMPVPAREMAVFLSETYFLGAKYTKEKPDTVRK